MYARHFGHFESSILISWNLNCVFVVFYDYQGLKNVFLVKILQFQIINRDRKFEKLYNSKVKTDDKSLLVQNVNKVKILKYSIFNLKKTTLPGLNFKMFSFKS